jgi:hypothetical protein
VCMYDNMYDHSSKMSTTDLSLGHSLPNVGPS